MTATTLLIIVLLLLGVALVAERELRRQRRNTGKQNLTIDAIATDVAESVAQLAHEAQTNLRRATNRPNPALANQFAEWAKHNLDDEPDVRDWLQNLPDVALRALVEQLDTFCRQLNVELVWLVDNTLQTEPEVQRVARNVVLMYCRNCIQAVELQPQIIAFRDFEETLAQIRRGEALTFGQRLIEALREAGLATAPEPSLVLATPAERRNYMADSIRDAAKQDDNRFREVWSQVLLAMRQERDTASQKQPAQARSSA